jgi:hypothetical protein
MKASNNGSAGGHPEEAKQASTKKTQAKAELIEERGKGASHGKKHVRDFEEDGNASDSPTEDDIVRISLNLRLHVVR